ncbi:MAG: hypothetical protein LV471_09200 [Nitrosomonas sp.]|nr:hypothetical protein [Nitrosomonas sp.]
MIEENNFGSLKYELVSPAGSEIAPVKNEQEIYGGTYKVFAPAGQFDAIFAEDEDIPIEYSGDELAISFFKDWLFINQVSGEHGHLLDSRNLSPRELYGFCQPRGGVIEVMPPFEDLLAYIQEDIENSVEDNDEQPQEENIMQAMITNDSAIADDEVKNIVDATLDSISGIDKIKLIKEAGSIRARLKTVQSGLEKLNMVKRIKEIRNALGVVSSPVEFKNPSKLFDTYLEEFGGDTFVAAKEFYKSELQGRIVKTVIGDVHMNGSSWREMKRGMKSDELKAKLIPKVPLILSSGKYDGRTELNKDRQDRFVAFHFFEMDVSIDSVIVTAGVNVGERQNGEYVYTVYGIGHDGVPNWIKKKAAPENSLDAALIRGETFRCPGVPSEPTAKPGSPISPLLTMDSILDESDNEVNMVILKVIKDTGERLPELEDNFDQQATIADVNAVMPLLKQFIGKSQLSAIGMGIRGEEGQFFKDKLIEIANVIQTMPKTYGQDGMGDKAIAYLHYFKGGGDWHITEKDMEDEQFQAFGLANIGYGGELGYISIQELIDAGVELDLYWTPKTIREIKGLPDKEKDDPNIGREWNAAGGRQKIVGIFGGDLYEVKTLEDGSIRRYSIKNIEEVIKEDEYRITPEYAKEVVDREEINKLLEESSKASAEASAKTDAEIAEFTRSMGMSPPNSEKARQALITQVRYNGDQIISRKKMIEHLVSEGRIVELTDGERMLTTPGSDTYMSEKSTTKTGMDYAEYLISKGNDQPQKSVLPADTTQSGFAAELEALKSETDINRFNERLDEIAARIEQAGLLEALDKELNNAADVLTALLSAAEKVS